MRWKDQACRTNGHLQHHLTTLNTVLYGWIDSQLKTAFLLGLSVVMSAIKWLVWGFIQKGRENQRRGRLSACQQQSSQDLSIDHKEEVCTCVCDLVCVCVCVWLCCTLQAPDASWSVCLPGGRDQQAGTSWRGWGLKSQTSKMIRKLKNRLKC